MLEMAGGPVEHIDHAARPCQELSRVVVAATKTRRAPVRLISEATWANEHGGLDDETEKGSLVDGDGNEVHYVVIYLFEEDVEWWDKLQIRKSDQELLAMETDGRRMREQ